MLLRSSELRFSRAGSDFLFHLLYNMCKASVLKRIVKSGFLYQAVEEVCCRESAELQIALPCAVEIAVHPNLVLQCICLRDAVVDVIQRAVINVMLLLPEAPAS